ncbi:hypothetical protein [Spirochaeta cellobiosiphila]|uniref:hypothetical protein n=1 Tax=Spirochaeta cellobiosiphila TaxID=504483 RepID=UPI00048E0252|nr:hypothetical protein [Spirochaeta cellobiosiphila]
MRKKIAFSTFIALLLVFYSCENFMMDSQSSDKVNSIEEESSSRSVSDFFVGLQLSDAGITGNNFGEEVYTYSVGQKRSHWSPWAFDSNKYNPDALRVNLEIASTILKDGIDFRIGFQCSDDKGGSQYGDIFYTQWASEAINNSEWSDWGGDSNLVGFDGIRARIETRIIEEFKCSDVRLLVQLADDKGTSQYGDIGYTNWATQGGGWSAWVSDSNRYDPDTVRVKLEVK